MALRILQLGIVFAIGFYLCPASPVAGAIKVANISISIELKDPEDVTVVKGQPATLRCEVKSSSPGGLEITWLHNDVPIASNDTRRYVQEDGSLHFPKVNGGKKGNGLTGEYRCRAKNSVGVVLSNPAKLKIASFEREFTIEPSNLTVPESQPAVLFCKINSVPAAHITWERDTEPLPHNSRYVPLPTGALLITKTHSSDAGSYRCIAKNSLLKKTKHSKIVQLIVSPSLTEPEAPTLLPLDISQTSTVLVGETTNLYCAVSGWPVPTVQWLNNDSVVISNSTVLHLTNITLKDRGNYTCAAYNSEGRVTRKYTIDVMQKPYFNVTPTSKAYPSARTVRLDCYALGAPQPEIYWLKDGKPLNIAGRIKKQQTGLVFSHTFTYDAGIYQCVAVNPAGRIWAAAQLNTSHTELPSPPENLQCRPYDDTRICLTWRPPENVSVQAYTIYSLYKDATGPEKSGPDYLSNVSYYLADNLTPSTNYTFYVRLYSKSASDDSRKVACETGLKGSRNLEFIVLNSTSVKLTWSKMSSDLPCNQLKESYRVEWKRKSRTTVGFGVTQDVSYIISGLIPSLEYEFRVTPEFEPKVESPWSSFTLPGSENSTITESSLYDTADSADVLSAPEQLQASPISPTIINLTWVNSYENSNIYYVACYFDVEKQNTCDNSNFIKSLTNNLKITDLQPDTLYKFQVRAHSTINGYYSSFSQPIEIRTPADVPSPVLDLKYKIINETTACLLWQAPAHKNGRLTRYLISYTPDHNWPLDSWIQKTIPASQKQFQGCSSDKGSISMLLVNLEPEKDYKVLVRAESDIGPGQPLEPITVTTRNLNMEINNTNQDFNSQVDHKRMGIIMGIATVFVCFVLCSGCIVVRRRCLKRRGRLRTPSNNYFPAVAHYASEGSSVQVRLEDPCSAECNEVEHLVPEVYDAHQLQNRTSSHLDSKGKDDYPNGHINGSAKPFLNGHIIGDDVRITENPRYYGLECNGHAGQKSKQKYEEDSNSNLKTSKFLDLHRIFENSKLQKYPIMTKQKSNSQCNSPVKKNTANNKIDDHPRHNSSFNSSLSSNEDDSLNSTQVTCLDNSFIMSVNNHRRVSPILGPNG